MDKLKEAMKKQNKIIRRWQSQIDFQKKNPGHYKTFKRVIDELQEEVNALKKTFTLGKRVLAAEGKGILPERKVTPTSDCFDSEDHQVPVEVEAYNHGWNAHHDQTKINMAAAGLMEVRVEYTH